MSASPREVEAAFSDLAETAQRLLAEFPDMPEEDQQLWADMLQGEASRRDPFVTLDKLINGAVMAEHYAEAVRIRRTELAHRVARHERNAEKLREVAQQFMEALRLTTLARPDYSASIAPGPVHVVLTCRDPLELAPRFQRVDVQANKAAIAKALKAGERVDGAELSNPQPVLSVRVR